MKSCRLQLGDLHYNEKVARKQAKTKDGKLRHNLIWPKYRKGAYVIRKITPSFSLVNDPILQNV